MADTPRTNSALTALLADNTSGDISAQDARDWLLSTDPEKYGIYNVARYGADMTGATNSQTAVEACIAAIKASNIGGVFYVPPGTLLCDQIRLTHDDGAEPVSIKGAGTGVSFIKGAHGVTTPVGSESAGIIEIHQVSSGWGTYRSYIEDVSIISTYVADVGRYGIYLSDVSGFHINRCSFSSLGDSALFFDGYTDEPHHNVVTNCNFKPPKDAASNDRPTIEVRGVGNGNQFENLYFSGKLSSTTRENSNVVIYVHDDPSKAYNVAGAESPVFTSFRNVWGQSMDANDSTGVFFHLRDTREVRIEGFKNWDPDTTGRAAILIDNPTASSYKRNGHTIRNINVSAAHYANAVELDDADYNDVEVGLMNGVLLTAGSAYNVVSIRGNAEEPGNLANLRPHVDNSSGNDTNTILSYVTGNEQAGDRAAYMSLPKQGAAPDHADYTAKEGDMYWDTGTSTLEVYDGVGWKTVTLT